MSKPVRKLNQLSMARSFIELRPIRGFRYIDRAGEIVNMYHRGDAVPSFKMGMEGLIIDDPIDCVTALKVAPDLLWMHFDEPSNLHQIGTIFLAEAKKIVEILEIEQFKRFGWRTEFVYGFETQEDVKGLFNVLSTISDTQASMIRVSIKTGLSFKANMIIKSVQTTETPPKTGVMFDIDVLNETSEEFSGIVDQIKAFQDYLKADDGFLKIVNATLEKNV